MSHLAASLIAALDENALAQLAAKLAPHMQQPPAADADRWLDTKAAAEYAGCTVNALHKAMARREVEFAQDCPGGKAWFKRSAIDAWRQG